MFRFMKFYQAPDGLDAPAAPEKEDLGLPFTDPQHESIFSQGSDDDVDLLPNQSRESVAPKQDDQADPSEPFVPEQQPGTEAKAEPVEKPSTKTQADNQTSVKIGESEYTQEQLAEILHKYNSMNDWESNLRSKTHISKLDPETVKSLVPYALAQREIPKNIAENPILSGVMEALKEESLSITHKDEYDETHEINIGTDALQPFAKKVIERTLAAVAPQLKEAQDLIDRVNRERGEEMLQSFISKHPKRYQFSVDFKQKSIGQHLKDVSETGKEHLDWNAAARLQAVYNLAVSQGFDSLDKADEFLYGEFDKQLQSDSELNGKIRSNQQKRAGEKPGSETPKMDEFADVFNWTDPTDTLNSIIPKEFR